MAVLPPTRPGLEVKQPFGHIFSSGEEGSSSLSGQLANNAFEFSRAGGRV